MKRSRFRVQEAGAGISWRQVDRMRLDRGYAKSPARVDQADVAGQRPGRYRRSERVLAALGEQQLRAPEHRRGRAQRPDGRMGYDGERAAMIYQHEARGADASITGGIDAHVQAERGHEDDGDDGAAGVLVPAG